MTFCDLGTDSAVAALERNLLSAGSTQDLNGLNADARLDICLALAGRFAPSCAHCAHDDIPAGLAAMNGHAAMVQKLVSLGASINHGNKGTLSTAPERNNVGAASIACAGAWTALHYAAKYSRVSVVETLIELNADPHSTTRYGDTALHVHCAELSSRSFPQESQARRDRGLQLALHE